MSLYTDENKMVIGELWHDKKEEDDFTVECALCGKEVDVEETYFDICEQCWTEHHNFDNALAYGASENGKQSIKVNGLFAKILTTDQIDAALKEVAFREYCWNSAINLADEFLRDDDGDFADWLKEQKGKE